MLKNILFFWNAVRTGLSFIRIGRLLTIWKKFGRAKGKNTAKHSLKKEYKRLKKAKRIAVFRGSAQTAKRGTKFMGCVISTLRKRYY